MNYTILQGDNRDTLKTLEDNSVDAIVTDPPYGIDFLGKAWDANTGALETYQECLRVLKPGGYILAFSAARTYHHLAVTLEQAGFEIRDQLMWLYASGFPKAQDLGKAIQKRKGVELTKPLVSNGPPNGMARMTHNQSEPAKYAETKDATEIVLTDSIAQQWSGWKTALKPAHEPICMARKPFKGSTIDNVLAHGVGALNIDATRIQGDDLEDIAEWHNKYQYTSGSKATFNNVLSEAQGKERQQHSGDIDSTKAQEDILKGRFPSNVLGEIPEYQKYFYCPKVSRKERHIGFDADTVTEISMLSDMGGYYIDEQGNQTKLNGKNIWLPQTGNIYIHGLKEEYRKWCVANGKTPNVGNNHPTVKPIELMKYLIKLVTPPNSTVLDPFNGSGSTGMAAVELGHTYIGCELDPNYVEIAKRRIEAWNTVETNNNYGELFE